MIDSPFLNKSERQELHPACRVLKCIEYSPSFDIRDLNPEEGDVFHIFVGQQYLTYNMEHIRQHKVFGSCYYSPDSDIAAMIFHSGILFIHTKLKNVPHRRFSTVQNVYQVMTMNEADYSRKALIMDLPADLQIKGVVVDVYIEKSPGIFPATTHNGYTSQLIGHAQEFSMRFTDFSILTMYDDLPVLVPAHEYEKSHAVIPRFDFTFAGDVGIKFDPNLLVQILSRYNVANGMFDVYLIFFDVNRDRFEICWHGGTKFSIVKFVEQISVEIIRNKNVPDDSATVVEDADLSDFSVGRNAIIVKGKRFEPVTSIILAPTSKYKMPSSINKSDLEK